MINVIAMTVVRQHAVSVDKCNFPWKNEKLIYVNMVPLKKAPKILKNEVLRKYFLEKKFF
jgi:hypothetical protein